MVGADRRRRLGILVLASGLGVICLFPGALFRGETFWVRDIQTYHRPGKSLVEPLWRASSGLPLWNPYFASGQPFAANPAHEIFHPLTALFLILPFEWAFRLQTILPVLGAAFSMFFLLDALGLGSESAILGALAWGFGGYTLSTTNLLPTLFAIATLPAVLAFAVRVVTRGGPGNLCGLSLMLGLECLAGEPSTLLMTALLIPVALADVALRRDGLKRLRRSFLPLAAGVLLGGAVGAATLLPGLHHASKTVRAAGLPDAVADSWSLPPVRLFELVAPRILGHVEEPDERWYWGRSLYPGKNFPFLFSIYPGLLVAVLSGLLVTSGPPRRFVWLGTALLGVLFAVGAHSPFWRLVKGVAPVLKGLRYPEKFILLTAFATVILSSLAFEELRGGRPDIRRRLVRSLGVVGGLATLAGLALLVLDVVRGNHLWSRWVGDALAPTWAAVAATDSIRIGVTAAVAMAALVCFRRSIWLVIAIEAVDLVLAGRSIVLTKPAALISAVPPVLSPLAHAHPPEVLFNDAAWDKRYPTVAGIYAPPAPAQWGIATTLESDFDLTELRWSHRATQTLLEAMHADPALVSPLLRRRGVAAVLRYRPTTAGPDGAPGGGPAAAPGPLVALLWTKNPSPLAFCVSRLVSAAGEEGWKSAVKVLGAETATSAVADPRDAGPLPRDVSPGDTESVLVRPGRVELDVNAYGPMPAFVAVNQSWDDGWSARVDAAPARLVRTDLSLSGLLVPPGRHHVLLVYSDAWVVAGIAVSLSALAAVVLVLAAGRRHRAAVAP